MAAAVRAGREQGLPLRAWIAALATSTLLACAGANDLSRCPAGHEASGVEALGDLWVGGFGPAGDDGGFLRVDFAADLARLHPHESRAPLGIVHPSLRRDDAGRDEARFAIDDGKHRRAFVLHRTAPDTLEGMVFDEQGVSAKARLVRLASYDRAEVDAAFAGTYAVDGDASRLLYVGHGRLFDTRDGSDRRLYLLSGRRALVGAGVAIAYPPLGVASVDSSGALRIEREGAAPVTARRLEPRQEELRFVSEGVTLQGTLHAPPGAGPHPAVVFVHGSGHSSRKDPWENAVAHVFLARGFAVFLYDKRGVGDSGGEYVGRGGRETNNVSPENLERLAGDARAAIAMMAARGDIDAARLGFLGLSQAGWIVPIAARRNGNVRFVVLMSAPTMPTFVTLAYESVLGCGTSCISIAAADRLVRDGIPRTGFDPGPLIAALEIPGLWIYGAADLLVPFEEAMRVLASLGGGHDFTVKLAPGAGHELYVVHRDTEVDRDVSTGLSPVALETLRTWLDEHVRP